MNDKGKTKRGSNYDPAEDQAIAKAWIRISNDGSVGINQTSDRFWSRVKDAFYKDETIVRRVESGEFEDRSVYSLQSRFAMISRETAKFMKCLKRALTTLESGKNDRDALVCALNIYQQTHKKKKAFEFQQCYEVLSSCPKFCLSLDDANSTTEQSSLLQSDKSEHASDDMTDVSEKCGIKKSKRVKQEKAARTQQLSIGAGIKKASEERNGLLRAYVMQTIFTANPVSDEHARFLDLQKKILLRELEAQAKSSEPNASKSSSPRPDPSQAQSSSSIALGFSSTSQANRATITALCSENNEDAYEE